MPRRYSLLLIVFGLTVGWFYAWVPTAFPMRWLSPRATGLYNELSDAFLAGQLHLHRQPDPRLIALADPYDPAQNAPFRSNDVSYFRGRYYLYHGAVPVLALFAPVKLLTGKHLTEPAAILIFCWAGFVASLGVLVIFWRANPVRGTGLIFGCSVLALGLGTGYQAVLRGGATNHVAIASAYCFVMLAFLALARALAVKRRVWHWLGLASLAYGLAIASRPNYVFGGVALIVPAGFHWWRQGRRWDRQIALNLIASLLPVVVVISGLLAYNYSRFGQPLEFGARYMLGAWDQRLLANFGLKYVGINAWYYFLSPGIYSVEFPFVSAPSWQAIGILLHVPFVWLALLLIIIFRPGNSIARPELKTFLGILAVVFLANLGLLLFLPSGNDRAVLTSANARYVFDFLPVLVLIACLSMIATAQTLAAWPRRLRILSGAAILLTMLTLLATLSLDLQHFPPESYRSVAQLLNLPSHFYRLAQGTSYGPVSLDVTFPSKPRAGFEPLISTGSREAGDLLYVYYEPPGQVRFGLVSTGLKGPLSEPVPINEGKTYHLEITMGSLYPSIGHPLLASLDESQVAFLRRTLCVRMDGQTVFDTVAHFYSSSPRQVHLGKTSFLRDYSAEKFSGQIVRSQRTAIQPPVSAAISTSVYGALRLVLRFPTGRTGIQEPLVVTGVQNAGDILYVQYASDRRVAIGLDHWGHRGYLTDWLPVDYSVNHTLEIHLGSLLPPAGHRLFSAFRAEEVSRLKGRVRVILDREVVLDAEQATYESSPYDVMIGKNIIGGSTVGYSFAGQIKQVTRLPFPSSTTPSK